MALRPGFQLHSLARANPLASISSSAVSPRYNTTSASPSASTSALLSSQARDRQTFTLPDGRILGFAEYGDPDGKPLIYFHGYPASRREPGALDDKVREGGIRLLSLDRPGVGLSTYQPDRKLTDWPEDVKAFAEGMGLKRFAVLGASGGGPYAVACANGLPRDMLSAAGVFAGGPPWEVGAHHMTAFRRRLGWVAEHWPRVLQAVAATLVGFTRWAMERAWVQRKLDAWLEGVVKKAQKNEGETVEKPSHEKFAELRDQVCGPMFDHFDQGAAGYVKETQILVRPWGFRFEDVKGRIQLWHGTEDSNAPVVMMQVLAKRLPNCDLQEFGADDHYTMGTHLPEAMRKMVSDDENKRV